MAKRWKYCGDINLEHGGFYWKEDGASDYVLAVRVTPCSDAGGPDNMFWIEDGSIYLSDDPAQHKQALAYCGYDSQPKPLTKVQRRAQLVESMLAYAGMDHDPSTIVSVGKPEPGRCEWNDKTVPDVVLRANASLANYVRKNYLQ
jgi:hypothetical protein